MKRPKRTDDIYWAGTRDFNHLLFEEDLQEYADELEAQIEALHKHNVSGSCDHKNVVKVRHAYKCSTCGELLG